MCAALQVNWVSQSEADWDRLLQDPARGGITLAACMQSTGGLPQRLSACLCRYRLTNIHLCHNTITIHSTIPITTPIHHCLHTDDLALNLGVALPSHWVSNCHSRCRHISPYRKICQSDRSVTTGGGFSTSERVASQFLDPFLERTAPRISDPTAWQHRKETGLALFGWWGQNEWLSHERDLRSLADICVYLQRGRA